MSRVHEVLHWANRRAVAEEVTRRGYRVSGETLNRWVREEKEFPAVVERIVFDLFTISGQEEKPPAWAEGLADKTAMKVIEALAPERLQQAAELARQRLAEPPAQSSDFLPGSGASTAPGESGQ